MTELRFADQKVIPGNGFSPHTGFTVFRAYDRELKKNVAVKMGGTPNTYHYTIKKEYEILTALDHPGIIKVYDYGVSQGTEFMVMESFPLGGRRSRWREQFKDMNTLQVTLWIRDLIDILEYLQEKNLLHEDVEMANIVAICFQTPILIDFGRVRYCEYSKVDLLNWLHPFNNTRVNAWVRELCGTGGKYKEEGPMVDFDIEDKILRELGEI